MRSKTLPRATLAAACLCLPPAAAEAQTFDIAFGPTYGYQDREEPTTPGWAVEGSFSVGEQTLVVEGAWYRNTTVREASHFIELVADPDGLIDFREGFERRTTMTRYWKVLAGVRSPRLPGRVRPYYQVAMGAGGNRFGTDIEWPEWIDTEADNAACGGYINGELVHPCEYPPYPDFDEQKHGWFMMQPSLGIETDIWRGLGVKVAADLPVLVSGEFVAWLPQVSIRAVVKFGER